ncbi:MAG: hypothetical protein Q4G40_08365 [Brachybacterium sp.]|nr:hypothetical protein [Brachybacterium sp.]
MTADDRTPSIDHRAPDPDQARAMLDEARSRDRSTPTPIPAALVTFGMMSVTSSLGAIALRMAGEVDATPGLSLPIAVSIALMACFAVSMLPLFLFRRDRWRRGFGKRWGVLITLWSLLWVVTALVSQTNAVLVLSPLFLVLYVIAVSTEAHRQRTSRGRIEGARR